MRKFLLGIMSAVVLASLVAGPAALAGNEDNFYAEDSIHDILNADRAWEKRS